MTTWNTDCKKCQRPDSEHFEVHASIKRGDYYKHNEAVTILICPTQVYQAVGLVHMEGLTNAQ